MNTSPLVLAVDLGSGGPKIGYVRVTGEPEWWWHERGDILAGSVSQDANTWWTTIVGAAQRGLAEGVDPARVVGVAVSGQSPTGMPSASTGTVLAH